MARVFGLWQGGSSYSWGEMATDGESWESLTAAKESLSHRYESGYWSRDERSHVVNVDEDGRVTLGIRNGMLYPAVTLESCILLYPATQVGAGLWEISDEPNGRLFFGPKGAVRHERF